MNAKNFDNKSIIYPDESYAIIGAGFLESVYQECLEIEFTINKIPYETQKELELKYEGVILRQKYKPDFVCFDKIIHEIKAISNLTEEHFAQVLNYLHANKCELGLLVNFGYFPKLEYKRIVR